MESQWRQLDDKITRASRAFGVIYGQQSTQRERDDLRARVGTLEAQLLRSTVPPTENQSAEIARAYAELADGIRLINAVVREDLPALLRGIGRGSETGISLIAVPPPPSPSR